MLAQELLYRGDRAIDDSDLIRREIVQETFDRFDAHCPTARKGAEPFRRRMHPNDAGVVAIDRLPGDPGPLHVAHEPAHRRRADLFGGGEGTEGLRTAHEHGQRRQLGW
jgi:hypothetical protein